MEYSGWKYKTVKQVSINSEGLKSYKVCSPNTMELNLKSIIEYTRNIYNQIHLNNPQVKQESTWKLKKIYVHVCIYIKLYH